MSKRRGEKRMAYRAAKHTASGYDSKDTARKKLGSSHVLPSQLDIANERAAKHSVLLDINIVKRIEPKNKNKPQKEKKKYILMSSNFSRA